MKYSVIVILPVERERTRSDKLDSILEESEMTGNGIRIQPLAKYGIVDIEWWRPIHLRWKSHMLSQCSLCSLDVAHVKNRPADVLL